MKVPKDHWIIQIDVTNACIHMCSNCTRMCGFHKKPYFMEYETFCKAVDSVLDHPGLIGVMGGEPTLHPRFADMCEYLYQKLPGDRLPKPQNYVLPTDSFIEMRRRGELQEFEIYEYGDGPRPVIFGAGLWTTVTKGYKSNFEIIQDVFKYQLLNDHFSTSYHQPVLVSRRDLKIDDKTWLKLRDNCWINQQWSSSITPKGCFFCEVAGALDMLYDGPGGLPIENGWWKRSLEDFKDQFHWCELCGIPLKTFARDAREGITDVSKTNYALLQKKETVKIDANKINLIRIENGKISEESKRSAAEYHGIAYIDDAQKRITLDAPIRVDRFVGILLCNTEEEFENSKTPIEKNISYFEKLYAVINGEIKMIVSQDGQEAYTGEAHTSLTDLLSEEKRGTYFILLTPEIELGRGILKLKECVVNPGTLHMVDYSGRLSEGNNPYIANDSSLAKGTCAILNNNASSLRKITETISLSADGLRELWAKWMPEKRAELSQSMDAAMYGVGDAGRKRETNRRRVKDSIRFVRGCCSKYGTIKTGYYGVRMVTKYGFKLAKAKLKSKMF